MDHTFKTLVDIDHWEYFQEFILYIKVYRSLKAKVRF
jgi:hypothetical protein